MIKISQLIIITGIVCLAGCHSKIKENKDEIYSRHLQKHISLTIVSTPVPKNKSDFNLLILNDGQDMKEAGINKLLDSLYRKKLIKPLVVVGVDAFDPKQEYGVAGFPDGQNKGSLAGKYSDFIVNELLPFIKKKSGVRSFRTVSIAGWGMAGVSAIDIAWDNWQKFDKVGFLPGFFKSNPNVDFSLLAEKILKSRKRPRLQFWLGQMDDIRNPQRNDSTGTKQLFEVLKMKGQEQAIKLVGDENEKNRIVPFRDSFSQFLMWLNEDR